MSARAEREIRNIFEEGGWLVVRAAGSLGIADLLALKPLERSGAYTALVAEVKETGENYADGTGFVDLTANSGYGRTQYAGLQELSRRGFPCVFIVRQKGQMKGRNLDVPRHAVHPVVHGVEPPGRLAQRDGDPLTDFLRKHGE